MRFILNLITKQDVRIIREDDVFYLSLNDVLSALKFEGKSERNFRDWIRPKSKEASSVLKTKEGLFYSVEAIEETVKENLSRIHKNYKCSFSDSVSFVNSPNIEIIKKGIESGNYKPFLKSNLSGELSLLRNESKEDERKAEEEKKRLQNEEKRRRQEKEFKRRIEEEKEEDEKRQKNKRKEAKQEKREDIIDENRSRLKIFFTNPIILFIPLFAAIVASGVDMAIVFINFFESDVASVALSIVFSSIILIFTFNSERNGGRVFVICFALIEAAVNSVYFGLIPSSAELVVVQICATIGLPLSLVAYANLFTKLTKK